MVPLFVLLGAFLISLIVTKIFSKKYDCLLSGRIAMAVMLVFTAIGHFAFTKGMTMMLPHFIPFKTVVIYLTAIFEIIAATGLLIQSVRVWTGWTLILLFVLLLPANVNAAIHHIDYQKGTFDGNGLIYLWIRIPLQLLFIGWTYLSAIKFYPHLQEARTANRI
jgi:uncharacterized membrane protein